MTAPSTNGPAPDGPAPDGPAPDDAGPGDLRVEVIRLARELTARGLSRGTSGNVSLRADGPATAAADTDPGGPRFWITPTGMDYAALTPDDIPLVGADGTWEGRRRPSSEWRFHRDVYAARPHVRAVLHAHPPFAVALACARRELPPFHYQIARFGGDTVRCAPYALFGTQELSDAVLAAMTDRTACLLANHGMLVCTDDPGTVLAAAVELEELCEQYWRSCQVGPPVLLTPAEMAQVRERFAGYGQQ